MNRPSAIFVTVLGSVPFLDCRVQSETTSGVKPTIMNGLNA